MPVIPTPSRKDLQKTPKIPERVQITPGAETQPITGESPADLLEAVKADLQERSGVLMDEIVVFRDQSVTWNDGSLGCPRPGMVYTQALVDGYWIVLKVGEREYDYRASSSGYFFLCEGGVLPGLQTPEIPPIPGQPPDL